MAAWMSVADAAAALDVDPRQVRNLIDAGALDAQRVGRAWAVDAASVRARSARPVAPGRPLSPGRAWQVLTVVDAALRYYLSGIVDLIVDTPPDGHHVQQLLPAMREQLQRKLDSAGRLRVPKDAGCFVARKR